MEANGASPVSTFCSGVPASTKRDREKKELGVLALTFWVGRLRQLRRRKGEEEKEA
jgi:hypothetical protein